MKEKKTDLRIEKTYLALHQAFTFLLEQKKFEDFTVNELCETAMIRRTTFYKHFADKYEYFDFYIRELSESFHTDLPENVEEGSLSDWLVCMTEKMFLFVEDNQKFVRHILESNLFPLLLNLLTENVRQQVMEKLCSSARFSTMDSRTLEVLAAFYAGGLTNTYLRHLQGEGNFSKEQMVTAIADIMQTLER